MLAGLRSRAVVLGILASGCLAASQAWGAGFCRDPALNRLVNQAAHDGLSTAQLDGLAQRLDGSAGSAMPDCDNTVAYCIGLKRALKATEAAYGLLGQDTPDLPGAKALLTEGRKKGSPWQLLVALGDVNAAIAHDNRDPGLYREAANALQFALNAINEPPLCAAYGEIRPAPEDVSRIRKRAEAAVLLSPRFDVTRTRSGDCGGIFLKSRGIEVEGVPVPITFAYDQATLTPEGEKAADALLQCAKEQKMPVVVLTGHTDTHGTDAYNMDLSARRLATVGKYLKAGGYGGDVKLIPMGEREPFQPDQTSQHSPEELDQMNRRVELRETKP